MDKIENQLLNSKKELCNIEERLNSIEKERVIKEYNNLKKEAEILKFKILKLIKEKQESCKHPLWYFLKSENDSYEGRLYWTCKCVECNKILEDRNKEFFDKKVVMSDVLFGEAKRSEYSFEEVQKAYNNQKKQDFNVLRDIKILIKSNK